MVPVLTVVVVILGYGLVSRRLEATVVSGPLVFVVAGIVLGPDGLGLLEDGMDRGTLRVLAEATLVLLLFTDAIRIDLRELRSNARIPTRLLGIGLPLTIVLGTVLASVLIEGLTLTEALVLGAVLAPTDAALGQAVVNDRRVPGRIRQGLNVESGLNDGLAAPVVTLAVGAAALSAETGGAREMLSFAGRQIGFGILAGVVVGVAGAWLLRGAAARGWVDGVYRQLVTLAVGVAAFGTAELVEGNGFVAAFVAGLGFGAVARDQCRGAYDFAEDEAQLLALVTFLAFGVGLAPAWGTVGWREVTFGVLALTVVRMLPTGLALIGAGLRLPTVLFLGWFGPRGLASILFATFLVEEQLASGARLYDIVAVVASLSVVAHGMSAVPIVGRYSRWAEARLEASDAEMGDVYHHPVRK